MRFEPKKLFFICIAFEFLISCTLIGGNNVSCPMPAPEKPIVEKAIIPDPAPLAVSQVTPAASTHALGVIGEVENVYFLPIEQPFLARIDTGAENSSIDAQNINIFEREGEKWVAFDLINRETNVPQHFEKKVHRQASIRRSAENEGRIVVFMTIKMGSEIITEQFSLADRTKFDYQVLIGRNILTGRAIVDTALAKTLY